ncbi:hypothetical protein HZB00_04065 [Candidatus Woesearchaeota archaeon]|nr:hypothetical protein [Candidatus Woesearchaeota archaeon]
MKEIHIKTEHHHTKTTHHEKRIEILEQKLEQVLLLLSQLDQEEQSQTVVAQKEEWKPAQESLSIIDTINELTTTQKMIFGAVLNLQQQFGYNAVSTKSLAKVIYPDKEYDQVRSTLSEYLAMLATFGLLAKKRKGKESFVTITTTGLKIGKVIKEEQTQRAKASKKRR